MLRKNFFLVLRSNNILDESILLKIPTRLILTSRILILTFYFSVKVNKLTSLIFDGALGQLVADLYLSVKCIKSIFVLLVDQ